VTVNLMNCPKCGKRASEYAPNKWECLSCGSRFVYEPPLKPDKYIKQEATVTPDEAAFFGCCGCRRRVSKFVEAAYVCRKCGYTFCEKCYYPSTGRCRRCESINTLIIGAIVVALGVALLWLLSLIL
jgi:ribosomal protein L37AE/L43A